MPTNTHMKCVHNWLSSIDASHIRNDSLFSYLFFTKNNVIKIRKNHSLVIGKLNLDKRIFLTEKEFKRGKEIEPSLYIRTDKIHCLQKGNRFCNHALIMKKIPKDNRLDLILRNKKFSNNIIIKKLIERIEILIKKSQTVSEYNMKNSLIKGNKRLYFKLKKLKNEYIASQWRQFNVYTNSMSTIFNKRVHEGNVKQLHGDLSLSNIFYYKNKIYLLDPSVAEKDMYILDNNSIVGDIITELYANGLNKFIRIFLSKIKQSKIFNFSNEICRYFLLRYSLIRYSINLIASRKNGSNNKIYEKIKQYERCIKKWKEIIL